MVERCKIYLAGGTHENWREVFFNHFPNVEFFDPSAHGLKDEKDYTEWDLARIRESDIIIAYMTATNPSGHGLALEIGYAAALGKTIIFVDRSDESRRRYFGMCRAVAAAVVSDIELAILHLQKLITGGVRD